MKVSFGIHLAPGLFLRRAELARAADLVKMAEDYGAEAIGTYDSAFIGDDAFVRASQMALASTRARIGLRPTNPLTREPQVMASFLATLDSITDGRTFMDIASGDSAVLNIGYKIATRARIEDYVQCVRALLFFTMQHPDAAFVRKSEEFQRKTLLHVSDLLLARRNEIRQR